MLFDYLTKGEGTFLQGIGSLRLVKGESTPRYSGEDLASGFYYNMAAQLLALQSLVPGAQSHRRGTPGRIPLRDPLQRGRATCGGTLTM